MRREGTLQIACLERQAHGASKYTVAFLDYAIPGGHGKRKEILGEDSLKTYLAEDVKVHPEAVQITLATLKNLGNAEIFHTVLTEEQLVALGLK